MKRLEARGSSDDTFGVYNVGPSGRLSGEDHDDCANFRVRAFLVDAGADGRILVTGAYGRATGTWAIGLSPVDEDDDWPTWAHPSWSKDGYTPVMALAVPDHATVTLSTIDGGPP